MNVSWLELFLSIVLLLGLAALAAAGLVLLWRWSRVAFFVGLSVVCLVGLAVVMAGLSLVGVTRGRVVSETPLTPREMNPVLVPDSPPTGGAWREAGDYFLKADVYPSAEAAARGLGAQLAEKLREAGIEEMTLAVSGRGLSEELSVMCQAIAEGAEREGVALIPLPMTAGHPTAESDMASQGPQPAQVDRESLERAGIEMPPDDVEVIHAVLGESVGTASKGGREERSGVLELAAPVRGQRRAWSAVYVDKPWVDRFSVFRSEHEDASWVVAGSESPEVDPAAAEAGAVEDAVRLLMPHLRQRAMMRGAGTDEARLQTRLREALVSGRMVEDRFLQRFERPLGNVYRSLMLVKIDPNEFDQIAGAEHEVVLAQRWQWKKTIFSAASLGVLILLGYGFLNLMTRGYYRGRLVVVALLVFGGMVLLMIA